MSDWRCPRCNGNGKIKCQSCGATVKSSFRASGSLARHAKVKGGRLVRVVKGPARSDSVRTLLVIPVGCITGITLRCEETLLAGGDAQGQAKFVDSLFQMAA